MAFVDRFRGGRPRCWILELVDAGHLRKQDVGPCDGVLIRAHLIRARRIRDQFPRGAQVTWLETERGTAIWEPVPRSGPETPAWLDVEEVVWDPRAWVPMCGGPMGNAGHHGMLDSGGVRRIKIERAWLPHGLEEYAEEHRLEWSLEADYGHKETT